MAVFWVLRRYSYGPDDGGKKNPWNVGKPLPDDA